MEGSRTAAPSTSLTWATASRTTTGLGTCTVAMRLADELGAGPELRADVFYRTLFMFPGCTADAHEVAATAGRDDES